ncbi:hypothetical protein [Polymorphum gilvum]|uniref:Uncharacterized protein n=1 Tax=Polymorphum gilvum (strain LMG 25793 / CGMCC 1.9160 / SL003B-26A1) TaxID=991905 RepID=F2J5N5_POLGS|nr:hypothetical protein [Polymorphum gilvum]ADZ70119.1 hypothetical protein SL003B_1691 [Polymorphum gilvum SL003B-26A1]
MFYAAIAHQNGTVDFFEAEDMRELARKFAQNDGGNHHVFETGIEVISVYSGKAHITSADGDRFWLQVMSDVMAGRDNDEWFLGEDKAQVLSEANEWLNPEDA